VVLLASLAGSLLLAGGPAAGDVSPIVVVFAQGDTRATIAVPGGWVAERRPQAPDVLVVRQGRPPGRDEPTLRVRVEPRPPGEDDAIRDAVFARFRGPRVWGTMGPSVWTADERHLWVEHFVDDDGKPSYVVASVAEPSLLVLFTLEASSLKSLQGGLEGFSQLVASYRKERTDPAGRLRALWESRHVQGTLLLLLPALLVLGLWCGLWMLLAFVGGWPFLARAYRARRPFGGPVSRWVTGYVGRTGYRGLTVGADRTGLYLANAFLVRPGHAPLFFPWADVQDVTTIRGSAWSPGPHLVFRFRRSSVAVKLPPKMEDSLKRAAGPAWPGRDAPEAPTGPRRLPGTSAGARVP
jgi:hypothetical protein